MIWILALVVLALALTEVVTWQMAGYVLGYGILFILGAMVTFVLGFVAMLIARIFWRP